MWVSIVIVGVIMAISTLLIMDWSLPAGLIVGTGTLHYAQTMAFTTLVLAQLFNVFNARSDETSAFRSLFTNTWVWLAILLSLLSQAAVVYLPLLQSAFSTVPLHLTDWLLCTAVASVVLWGRELAKLVALLAKKRSFEIEEGNIERLPRVRFGGSMEIHRRTPTRTSVF